MNFCCTSDYIWSANYEMCIWLTAVCKPVMEGLRGPHECAPQQVLWSLHKGISGFLWNQKCVSEGFGILKAEALESHTESSSSLTSETMVSVSTGGRYPWVSGTNLYWVASDNEANGILEANIRCFFYDFEWLFSSWLQFCYHYEWLSQ